MYRRLISSSKSSIACIAGIALASGLARGVATADPAIGAAVNAASVAGSLIGAAVLLYASSRFALRLRMTQAFRVILPLVTTGFLAFPFLGHIGLSLFAGITYLAFSIVTLLAMRQSAQISRDRGTNPVLTYGLYAGASYTAQSIGFLPGWISANTFVLGVSQAAMVSIAATYAMCIALLVATRTSMDGLKPQLEDAVEFVSMKTAGVRVGESPLEPDQARAKSKRRRVRPSASGDVKLADRLSKQCLVAKDLFGLSFREMEVMELIARGFTVPAIAEKLTISENTVRTHSKHVYTKLDVHSKAELAAALEKIDPPQFQ